MAVEAGHPSLFSPQLLTGNRQMMNVMDQGNGNVYNNAPTGYGMMPPLSGTTTDTLCLPMYGSGGFTDSIPAKTALNKADSGLTYSLPISRKRPRDSSSINPLVSYQNAQNLNQNQFNTFSFLGEDISIQIQQQQYEIDLFIAQHTEKIRMDIEERGKRNSRRIIAAVEEGLMKRFIAKEEEIAKIGKLNWMLEEKVKSLCIENQIWRELAQTNEATANALRSNLKQVLAQVQDDHHRVDDLIDDAQSCCESNFEEQCTLAENNRGGERKEEDDCTTRNNNNSNCNGKNSRWCRNCGKDESCVLLLPCRHLCLCRVCASSINICPVCKSTKNASVHINMT